MARLIDADALMMHLGDISMSYIPNDYDTYYERDYKFSVLSGINIAGAAVKEALTVDPIELFKAWIGEIMLNIDNEPIEPSEIIRRIDEGGLKRFIDDHERERKDG